ncbi:phosphoribosylglycinamide synthetase [Streptomyces sp. TRM68416]|uniref:phosphoribosylglycinamide synthetase n=1 Tax=Streptomyces sp. TRM68416 TaxID=2758412 RepID=UPI001661EE23|nr:phosphoribosylglycinamide synthetase [Streptomyces sp. TRM68416]MBD0840758.1 phosphoribosylglycinamide synthetase [Streptomyces sp. TRM68416]
MQTRPDRILMVLPRARLVRKAVDAGHRVWSVWDPVRRDAAERGEVARYSEEVLTVDVTDESALRALVVRAAQEHRIGHVMYLGSGMGAWPVLEEAHRLGLGANPPQSHLLLGDRAALCELLHGHARLGVCFRRVELRTELHAAVDELGGPPVVVRSLARDVDRRPVLAPGPGALEAWAGRTPGPYLVEEFLAGPQYTVSTLSVDGMHQVVGITATRTGGPPHLVTLEHVHPAPLGDRESAEIRSAVCALLDLAGFEHGPADITVVLTGTGPRIVSSRPGFSRDGIPLLLRLARGVDLEAAFFQTLTISRCLPHTDAVRTAGAAFFQLPPGRLTAVADLDEIRALPHVHAVHFPFRPGDPVPGMTDGATVPGFVVVDGANAEETAERLAAVRRLLRAEAEPAP